MADSPGAPRRLPEDIFNDALELPAERREAYLARACAGDEELRAQLEEMLALAGADPILLQRTGREAVPRRLGKYELLEERGRGGMGIVYQARDTQLDRVVALKLLPAGLARDADARERFAREARLLATLRDERLATLYTFEEVQGFHFLTMEYVEGRTLAELVGDGPLALPDCLYICRQIAEALAVTHARQIIHRDLKPSNIMITPAGGVKILDFGIARALDEVASREEAAVLVGVEHTAARGTPAYMSPEQLLVERVDHRCDLWALGCVLYECLTGQRAIAAGEPGDRPDLSDLRPRVPEAVRDLVGRCLEVDPRRREASAGNAAAILGRTLANMSGRGRPRRSRRRMALPAALAVGLAVLALGLARTSRPAWMTTGSIESVEVSDSRVLRAKDAAGRAKWTRSLPAAVIGSISGARGDWVRDEPKLVRAGGRVSAVIAATEGFPGCEGGAVWCLRPSDGHPRWRWDAVWQLPVNAKGTLRIHGTAVLAGPGRGESVIVAVLVDGRWYGSAVQFLDQDGQAAGTYYHPGALEHITTLATGSGSTPTYLLAGLNSSARFVPALNPLGGRAHCGCLVLLPPDGVSGQGFPYSEGLPEARDWPGMPRAREIAYVAIPLLAPEVDSRVISLSVDQGPDGSPRVTTVAGDGRYFFFDRTLGPLACYVPPRSIADSLNSLGEARFLPLMVIRDGRTTWQDVEISF